MQVLGRLISNRVTPRAPSSGGLSAGSWPILTKLSETVKLRNPSFWILARPLCPMPGRLQPDVSLVLI